MTKTRQRQRQKRIPLTSKGETAEGGLIAVFWLLKFAAVELAEEGKRSKAEATAKAEAGDLPIAPTSNY